MTDTKILWNSYTLQWIQNFSPWLTFNVSLTLVEDCSKDIYSIQASQAAVYWLCINTDLLCSERMTPSHFPCSFLCSLFTFPDVSVALHDLSFKNNGLYCGCSVTSNRFILWCVYSRSLSSLHLLHIFASPAMFVSIVDCLPICQFIFFDTTCPFVSTQQNWNAFKVRKLGTFGWIKNMPSPFPWLKFSLTHFSFLRLLWFWLSRNLLLSSLHLMQFAWTKCLPAFRQWFTPPT